MATNTTTYSFQKPTVGGDEDAWGGYLNSNWDSVDDLLDGTTPVTGIDINSGSIDGTAIGANSASTGNFSTLSISSTAITSTAAELNKLDGFSGEVGFRAVPQSGSAKTSSYTLQTSDVGQFIEVGSGGSITVPDATFSAGDVIVLFNNTSGNVTVTCSIATAYIGGTNSDKSSVTLATRGICNILFLSGTVCVITGNVT